MKVDIEAVKGLVLEEATNKEKNASYSGTMGDGGGDRLREQVRFYQMGQNGEIPDEWKQQVEQLDPEWKEFQRLKQKFEGPSES